MNFDINTIRQDFPILATTVYGKPLVYLDNGATTQKPRSVLDTVRTFYETTNANIHRAVHKLSSDATEIYENARETVRNYLNARTIEEIIFTKGTTDAINLVAWAFGEAYIREGDEILVSETEHHSNIVPWKMLCERKKAVLKVIPADENGELIFSEFQKLLTSKTKLVAVAQVSNAFGIIHPIEKIIAEAHKIGAKVLIDGAQGIQHFKVDVQKLDCDFYAFSGHKIYAETGIGVLYGKKELLNAMPPYQGGGDMIKTVCFKTIEYADLPLKYEAGTANYVGAASLAAAINYVQTIGLENIQSYENELLVYATEKLKQIEGLRIIGDVPRKTATISFLLGDAHPYDVGTLLDKLGIAVRTGTHCAQPAMQHFGITGTVRASMVFYNTKAEIDALYEGLLRVKKMLG